MHVVHSLIARDLFLDRESHNKDMDLNACFKQTQKTHVRFMRCRKSCTVNTKSLTKAKNISLAWLPHVWSIMTAVKTGLFTSTGGHVQPICRHQPGWAHQTDGLLPTGTSSICTGTAPLRPEWLLSTGVTGSVYAWLMWCQEWGVHACVCVSICK